MPLYEHVFLARQDISNQQNEMLIDQFKAIVEEGGGKVAKVEYWGTKPLAYQIRKNRKAHFTMLHIDGPSECLKEMERKMKLNGDVLRHLTIRVKAFEDGPSVMMAKRDRNERPIGRRVVPAQGA